MGFLHSRRGFTLIEILISVTLSAILMTGILVFVSGSISWQKINIDRMSDRSEQSEFKTRLSHALSYARTLYASGYFLGSGYGTGVFLGSDTIAPVVFIGSRSMTGYCDTHPESTHTGSVERLAIRYFMGESIQNSPPYVIDMAESSILSGSVRIVGTGYPGYALSAQGVDTELNGPSSIVRQWNTLYIADTMNRRVLAYDLVNTSIVSLLSADDGLRYPTGLALSGSTLLVTDGRSGKVFSISDGSGTGSVLNASFYVSKSFSADTIRFSFSGIPVISSPSSKASITFGNIPSYAGDLIHTGAELEYVFSGGTVSFSAGIPYSIKISDIAPAPTTPGASYFVSMFFYQWGALSYSESIPYITIGDGSIATPSGNSIRLLAKNRIYPHSPDTSGGWEEKITAGDWLAGSGSIADILSWPIEKLSVTRSAGVLTIHYYEYVVYDCLHGRHSLQERVHKIKIPD